MTNADSNLRGATLVAVLGAIGLGALLWFGYTLIYFVISSWNHNLADLFGGWLLFMVYFMAFYFAISAMGWLLLGVPTILLTRRYQRHDWPTFMTVSVSLAVIILLINKDFFGMAFAATVVGQVALYLYLWQRQQPASSVASD